MLTFVKVDFLRALLGRITNDHKTTVLGIVGAAVLASKLDWGLLLKGDATQEGTAVGVIVTALLGYYTNRPNKPSVTP